MDPPTPDDAETQRLLQLARAGDRQALDRLFAMHRAYLRRVVELRMDPHLRLRLDPSDVVQESQGEAVARLDGYFAQPALPFRLWLRQLACDRLRMQHRFHLGAARRTLRREVALPDQSSLALAQQLLASGSTPSRMMAQEELVQRVRQAVARLSEADREVLLMRTFEGLAFEEVGQLLRIDPAAARKRHGRAILRLHKALAEGGLTGSSL